MKNLYKFEAEGVWFSKNGTKAYKRGEKPLFLFKDKTGLIPTIPHHIAREYQCRGKLGMNFTRELVMFYKKG